MSHTSVVHASESMLTDCADDVTACLQVSTSDSSETSVRIHFNTAHFIHGLHLFSDSDDDDDDDDATVRWRSLSTETQQWNDLQTSLTVSGSSHRDQHIDYITKLQCVLLCAH